MPDPRSGVPRSLASGVPPVDGTGMDSGSQTFTFVDLFAGIGGMRLGFEQVGGECVFTSEWNKFAQETYRANFQVDHDLLGDITKVTPGEIPSHDVLLAGFPCQPFSLAGVSKKNSLGRAHGFADPTQGTLFFDIKSILQHHRPKAFLLENVKHLERHDGGRTFEVILDVLRNQIGYDVHYRVINSRSLVPQSRARLYIVGFTEEAGVTFDFDRHVSLPDPEGGPTLSSILHPEDGSEAAEDPYTVGKSAQVNPKYVLSDNLWDYLQSYAAKHRRRGNGFGFGLVGPADVARTLSARYHKDGSEILIQREGSNPRRLTPRECARLMGFDRYGTPMVIPVSDTQAYRQFGNSVVVPVIEAVARGLIARLHLATNPQQDLALGPEMARAG
jgi:DNA (cytosine-5)-methyltransferase 1